MGKSFLSLAAAVCTAGLFGGWGHPAHAQTILVSDVIAFQGAATVTSDGTSAPCGDPVPDLIRTEVPAVDLVGGCGSFTFTSNICAGYSDGDPTVGLEVGPCTIWSTATFANAECGTGVVDFGSVASVGVVEGASVRYGIVFNATIGFVTGSITDTTGDGAGQTELIASGVIQLSPGGNPNTQDGPVDCTNGFSITGSLVVGEGPGS